MKREQIADGVFVTELPGEKFNKCKISVHMLVPGLRETATALAILPNILNRSCADIPDPVQLSRYFFGLYGAELASESYQVGANRVVSLAVSGVKNGFALNGENLEQEYADILCKLIFKPKLENGTFTKEDISIEKEKQEDFLKSEMNNKRSYVLRQARRKLFGDSPQGIESAGYIADIASLASKDVFACYLQLLENAVFEIMVSGASAKMVADVILPYISRLKRAPQQAGKAGAITKQGKADYYEENMDTAQGKLCLFFVSGKLPNPKQATAMRLGVAILGMLPTSRLFMNVREKQGLCYYCAAHYSAHSGTLCLDSGIEHANAKKAAAAIIAQLEIMQQQPVTDEELGNAVLALQNSFISAADSLDAVESWVFNERLQGTNITLQQAEDLLLGITAQDICDAMAGFTLAVEYAILKGEEK